MRTVRKYKMGVEIDAETVVQMPAGAEVIHFGAQGQNLFIWALVDPNAVERLHNFYIYGTGWNINQENLKHVGSWVSDNFVWHIFKKEVL